MIRAIIADDEPVSTRLLKEVLEASGKVTVVGVARNGTQCLELMDEEELDVAFLDIQMPELSGLEVAEIAFDSEKPPLIVFITGYDQYAVNAFELAAVDYVVKTDDLDAFAERVGATIRRVEAQLTNKHPDYEALRGCIMKLADQYLRPTSGKLPIKDYEQQTVRLLDPTTVVCVERKGRRTVLRTMESNFPTYFTIDSLEQRLASRGFIRANRSALLNLSYVEHLIPNGDGSYDAIIEDEEGNIITTITVSRGHSRALLESLGM